MRRITFLSRLHILRAPLGALAMIFVVANLLAPATLARAALAQGASWQVLCSDVSVDLDGETLSIADCERCCLTPLALVPQPDSHLIWQTELGATPFISATPHIATRDGTGGAIGPRAPPARS